MSPSAASPHEADDAVLADAVASLVRIEAAISALEAERFRQLARAHAVAVGRTAHRPRTVQERELALRSIAAEVGVALRWHDRTAQRRITEAGVLVEDFATTVTALVEAKISARHADVIREIGAPLLEPQSRDEYERRVLARAENDTVAGTRAFARAVADELEPRSITERHDDAVHRRRVWVEDDRDGMAQLGVIDSATKIRAMFDRLTRQARAVRRVAGAGGEESGVTDTRSIDQTRTDLLCDLVLGGRPVIHPTHKHLPGGLGAIRAEVSVVVPVMTAVGASERGALLDGCTPVDADTARRLLADAPRWERLLTDPVTGVALGVDRYRPTPSMRRFLRLRDVHCRFPGCRQPARRCEIDHNLDHAKGGQTALCNLACLCKRHHVLKTETPWTAAQQPDGSIVWTSPLGRRTSDPPERRVAFAADPDPGPGPNPDPDPPPF
ncbi:HNH endonuclease signature motif containing protein [uncultured Microbacterium sp.]|uniref:HNH endonuclease signature motif containing protein n=1 Tax=uncultured Microbacterium sp. TaxID=191216 RepID=UPI0025D309D6|nr:HNH endonuclease signature motif containing protein [uncultured Microbacterium sp.]